mgnify:CR=1 FL=1
MQILPLSSWILVVAALLMLACAQSEPVSRMPTRESTIANQTAASLVSPVGEVWKPVLSTSWQWQLTDPPIGHSIDAEMFDIDLFETNAATVAALHADGRKVICYVNLGGWKTGGPMPPSSLTGLSALISMTGKVKSGWTSGELTCWGQ